MRLVSLVTLSKLANAAVGLVPFRRLMTARSMHVPALQRLHHAVRIASSIRTVAPEMGLTVIGGSALTKLLMEVPVVQPLIAHRVIVMTASVVSLRATEHVSPARSRRPSCLMACVQQRATASTLVTNVVTMSAAMAPA